jgi:hypothetical protein
MAKPALIERCHPAMRAAIVACCKGFGAAPVFLSSGGTIPVVDTHQERLGIRTALTGYVLADDRMHVPLAEFHLPKFYPGSRHGSGSWLQLVGGKIWQLICGGSEGCATAFASTKVGSLTYDH